MKTKSVKTLVATLKRHRTAYANLAARRAKKPERVLWTNCGKPSANQRKADRLSGLIMRTERRIINALLKEAK